jgi:hypothetical protein
MQLNLICLPLSGICGAEDYPDGPNHEVIAWNFYQKAKEQRRILPAPMSSPKYQMKMTITVKPKWWKMENLSAGSFPRK